MYLERGVIIGCDHRQERLLQWWWKNYSAHNDYPVTFCDFGLSECARTFCAKRGNLIEIAPQVEITQGIWNHLYEGDIDSARKAWMKKPFALINAPYEINLWMDVDCEVKGNIEAIFNSLIFGGEIGVVKDADRWSEIPNYNAGLILFKRMSSVIDRWARTIKSSHDHFPGDQEALCYAITKAAKGELVELPPEFNWLRWMGHSDRALVVHHTGLAGKEMITEMAELDV